MKIKNNLLDIFVNGTNAKDLNQFGLEYPLTLASSGHIDVGFRKQLSQIFVEIKTANTVTCSITVQKHNGTDWETINIVDETNGFKKSGFIYFDEDAVNSPILLNGITQMWYRIKVSQNTSAMVLMGLNLVFCNLADLKIEEPAIESFYPREIRSHIFSMVAARDYILRRINNGSPLDYYIINADALTGQNYVEARLLTQFDIFDINELRDAAVNYALHKIFSNRSDETDDVYFQKSEQYKQKFEYTFKLFTGRQITIDINDDGKKDEADKGNSVRQMRLYR